MEGSCYITTKSFSDSHVFDKTSDFAQESFLSASDAIECPEAEGLFILSRDLNLHKDPCNIIFS